jgi:hypothetical protein
VTADEERALLAATAARIDEDMREHFNDLVDAIIAGATAREAVAEVLGDIEADLAATLAAGLSAVLREDVTAVDVLQMNVGAMRLSPRLFQEADEVTKTVAGIVDRHLKGFTEARTLALELFEGYAFRNPEAEPLQFKAGNPKLPQYLREVLRTEPGVERALAAKFAQLQVNGLENPGLRAAYTAALDAISEAVDGVGAAGLKKRLEIAWFERMRFFAQRIAQTEIHRAFARREALALMADVDVEFVQIRRAPGEQLPCICDLFAGRDVWGMGRGVYPKAKAPLPPFHPYCRCVTAPRLDLTGQLAEDEPDDSADVSFLQRLNPSAAARVVGSREKLQRVLDGEQAVDVVNAARDERYAVKTLAEA